MFNDGALVVRQFWNFIEREEYGSLLNVFAANAKYVDPVHGIIIGNAAIAEHLEGLHYWAKNSENVGFMGGGVFELMSWFECRTGRLELSDLCADGEAGWASWRWLGRKGEVDGASVYRVQGGEIIYCREYLGSLPPGG